MKLRTNSQPSVALLALELTLKEKNLVSPKDKNFYSTATVHNQETKIAETLEHFNLAHLIADGFKLSS